MSHACSPSQTVDTNIETVQQATQVELPHNTSTSVDEENSPETTNENDSSRISQDSPVVPQLTGNQGITRLSKLNIPVFSGDSLHWQSFWDCFEAAIHCNPSLTGVQKLNYL